MQYVYVILTQYLRHCVYNNKTKLWLRNELRSLIGISTCCSRYRLPYISDLGYVLWVASSTTQVEHEVIVHFVSARRLPCWLHFIIASTVLTYKTFSSLIWIYVIFFLCKGFVWCAYWSIDLIKGISVIGIYSIVKYSIDFQLHIF